MNTSPAVLDLTDFAVIAFIDIVFAGSASFVQRLNLRRVGRKLDALLQHQGINLPSDFISRGSTAGERPKQQGNRHHASSTENPDISLADVKVEIESLANAKCGL